MKRDRPARLGVISRQFWVPLVVSAFRVCRVWDYWVADLGVDVVQVM
jgi:hypothetical protein